MESQPRSAAVQGGGCDALLRLCSDNANVSVVSRAGAVKVVVAAMRRHAATAAVARHALAVTALLTTDEQNLAAFVAAGGLVARLVVMRAHPDDAELSVWCSLLVRFTDVPQLQEPLVALGALPVVLAAMTRHSDSSTLLQSGMQFFAAMCDSEAHRAVIADAGVTDVAVAAMRRFADDASVQTAGCYLLVRLAASSTMYSGHVAAAGGVEVVLASLQRFGGEELLQAYGCGALEVLASIDDGAAQIIRCGGAPLVVAAMRRFPHPALLQARCVTALALLADSSEGMVAVGDAGGIEAVVAAMQRFLDDTTVQKFGFVALERLARLERLRDRITACDGHLCLVAASVPAGKSDEIDEVMRVFRREPGATASGAK
jgi:hypothetical protein